MNKQLEQTIAKIEALPEGKTLWMVVTGEVFLWSDEVKALAAEVKRLREGLEHYADESNWSDVHPDVSITPASLYVYEDEFDGAVEGYFVARATLKEGRLK